MKSLNKWVVIILKSIGIIIVSAIIGWALLLLAYMVPTNKIAENVKNSEQYFGKLNMFEWCSSCIVPGMDSIVSFEAIYEGPESLVDKSLSVYRYQDESIFPETQMVQGTYLSDAATKMSYARYWHGYLAYVKPMYYFLTFNQFRIINVIVHLSLLLLLCISFFKKNCKELICPIIFSYLLMGHISSGYGFQNSHIFIITMIASIILVLKFDRINAGIENVWTLFLLIGINIAYFDYLTYPAFSFGIPAAIYFYMKSKKEQKLLDKGILNKLKEFVILGIAWVTGYVGMWSVKWIIATLFTDNNIIQDAFMTIGSRTSTVSGEYNLIPPKVYWINMRAFFTTPFVVLVGIYLIALIVIIISKKYYKYAAYNTILLIICMIPFAWFTLTQNHSWEHSAFTMKSLAITSFAGLIWLQSVIMVGKQKMDKDNTDVV